MPPWPPCPGLQLDAYPAPKKVVDGYVVILASVLCSLAAMPALVWLGRRIVLSRQAAAAAAAAAQASTCHNCCLVSRFVKNAALGMSATLPMAAPRTPHPCLPPHR